ncbi:hypothetical protein LTR10_019426 [Elasticomyces elasticus]|uniref:ABM domain-containing protein n=1 Tax=Exophiala sideris TaxID=1016849 RepID=A0ABR0J430_9EURO|nr:hypothetical protein LTR10_019426 [Elasticomyces elasticus]KAK5024096.1 hypothetical protein LTS07_008830 [Exophiala sideris]KAK5029042.1 hypothetical protein LTR13_008913 [Exophiala sideris]KAK5054808.1 hypothetical protein LTR69_008715 [Exophiala sideris]KAK5178865.1 hypothetical protein LTR44_008694 [Eurotiomycetes sp. CCFEE 6388]
MYHTPISISKDITFVLTVKVYIDPSQTNEFFALFKPAYESVLAEPECRFFIVNTTQEPGCISWVEGWSKDVQWFMAEQMTKPYYQPYLSKTEAMFIKPREFEFHTPQEGMCHFKLPLPQID